MPETSEAYCSPSGRAKTLVWQTWTRVARSMQAISANCCFNSAIASAATSASSKSVHPGSFVLGDRGPAGRRYRLGKGSGYEGSAPRHNRLCKPHNRAAEGPKWLSRAPEPRPLETSRWKQSRASSRLSGPPQEQRPLKPLGKTLALSRAPNEDAQAFRPRASPLNRAAVRFRVGLLEVEGTAHEPLSGR